MIFIERTRSWMDAERRKHCCTVVQGWSCHRGGASLVGVLEQGDAGTTLNTDPDAPWVKRFKILYLYPGKEAQGIGTYQR